MHSRILLLAVGLGLACSFANPAYEDSGPTGASDDGPGTLGVGSNSGSTAVGPVDSTAATSVGPSTTTTDPTTGPTTGPTAESSETGPTLPGCDAPPPPPGTVCHQPDPVGLPPECVPRPVHVVDIDEDGRGEVLVGCADGPLLLFPNEVGGLGEPVPLGEAGVDPRDIAVAQLDDQHGVDIVVVDHVGVNGVRVFFDEGNGTYTTEMYDPASSPTSVAVGRWYEHALPDIVTTDPVLGQVVRLESTGPRAYQLSPPLSILSGDPQDVVLGQLDGEGAIDMAVISSGPTPMATVIFNMGNGGESQPSEFSDSPLAEPNRLLLDDVDEDGTTDILYTRGGVSGLRRLMGQGGGMFDPEGDNYGVEVRGLGGGDFDGNGRPDTVLADHDGATIIFLMRFDDGSEIPTTLPVGGQPWSISTGMLDGDALPDVIVSLEDTDELVVALSAP